MVAFNFDDHSQTRTLCCAHCFAQDLEFGPGRPGSLLQCSKCHFARYCDAECQRADWQRHKVAECAVVRQRLAAGEKRVDILPSLATRNLPPLPKTVPPARQPLPKRTLTLDQVWPILAISTFLVPGRRDAPTSPIFGRIIRQLVTMPDQSKLLRLGAYCEEPIDMTKSYKSWCPAVRSEKEASRLFRRVISDRVTLEASLGLMLALRHFLEQHDFGLTWYDKPIVDFGVVSGRIFCPAEDYLAYEVDGRIIGSADPKDASWLWFQAENGEVMFCNFYRFIYNYHLCLATGPFKLPSLGGMLPPGVPGEITAVQRNVAVHPDPRLVRMQMPFSTESYYRVARSAAVVPLIESLAAGRKDLPHLAAIVRTIRRGKKRGDGVNDRMSIALLLPEFDQAISLLQECEQEKLWDAFPRLGFGRVIMDEDQEY